MVNAADSDGEPADRTEEHKVRNALGTLNGCYVPCSLNIMGAVMFMRLGWATGEAGMIQVVSMLGIATMVTVLTGLSLSAIATNGDMVSALHRPTRLMSVAGRWRQLLHD